MKNRHGEDCPFCTHEYAGPEARELCAACTRHTDAEFAAGAKRRRKEFDTRQPELRGEETSRYGYRLARGFALLYRDS